MAEDTPALYEQRQKQKQWAGVSPRSVVVSQVQATSLQLPDSIPEEALPSHNSPRHSSREAVPGSPRSAAVVGAVSGAAPAAAAAARDAVKALFASHLGGLAPAEENRRSLQFLVPRAQQQQLVGLLQQLEAAMAAAAAVGGGSSDGSRAAAVGVVGEEGVRALRRGVADVSLSLTSLEEVFLSIAKQVCVLLLLLCGGVELHIPRGADENLSA